VATTGEEMKEVFRFIREGITIRTVIYSDIGGRISKVYLPKDIFPEYHRNVFPDRLRITIEEEE